MPEIEEKEVSPSVADSVRAAISQVNSGSEPVEDTPADVAAEPASAPEKTVDDAGQPRGPDGKFAPKTAAEEVRSQAGKRAKGTVAAPVARLDPPQHWPEEDKQFFSTLPDDGARQRYLDKVKNLETGYNKKFEEVAAWKKAVEPYDEYLKGFNTTPHQAVAYLMNSERVLRYGSPEQKMEMLRTLAKDYQIPLPNGAPNVPVQQPEQQPGQGEHWDPTVQALQQKLSQVESLLSSRQQQEHQVEQQRVISEIAAFQNATTEAGQPANPYFAEVADDIAMLAYAERQAGRKPVLKDLYDKAVWANPNTRAKAIADRDADAAKQRQAEAAKRTQQARNAGSSVSGAPVGGSASGMPASTGSVRGDVMRAAEQIRGGRV